MLVAGASRVWTEAATRSAQQTSDIAQHLRGLLGRNVVDEHPMADSLAARYLSLVGVRRIEYTCRNRWARSRPTCTGACCQPAT